jgi:glutamine amidotransferase
VHRSLIGADKSLATLSEVHADGWGVAYYVGGAPHLVKSAQQAMDDALFRRISGVVTSETVLAHVRKATHGSRTLLNCHPFQFGRWVFAHNGTVHGFAAMRDDLLAMVRADLRAYVLGETDSEVLFAVLLTEMARRHDLHDPHYPLEYLVDSLRATAWSVWSREPSMHPEVQRETDPNCLTFVVTNGDVMVGHQGGRELHVSTHKERCQERANCPHFGVECEMRVEQGPVRHFMLSSEPLLGENVWERLSLGEVVGVDGNMRLHRFGVDPRRALLSRVESAQISDA